MSKDESRISKLRVFSDPKLWIFLELPILALEIAMVVVGAQFEDDYCPEHRVPLKLMIYGGILLGLSVYKLIVLIFSKSPANDGIGKLWGLFLLGLIGLGILIFGLCIK